MLSRAKRPSPVRLDRFIASSTGYSRRQVKELIKQRRVKVSGADNIEAKMPIKSDQQVVVNGQEVSLPGLYYWMVHKPKGVISATSDANRTTIMDVLDMPRKEQLQLVGRLDKDTTGLLLLTNDGQWNHKIAHPKKDVSKVYLVTAERPISQAMIDQLEGGIYLKKEDYTTLPAVVETTEDPCVIRLSIGEGKYHQVKRMLIAVSNCVLQLHREKIGPLVLDPTLEPGQYRLLNEDEIKGMIVEQ